MSTTKQEIITMQNLQFKHVKVGQSFVKGCGLFIKVTKTQALSIIRCDEKYDRIKFKGSDSVAPLRKLKFSSFTQGAYDGSFPLHRVMKSVNKLIAEYETAKA